MQTTKPISREGLKLDQGRFSWPGPLVAGLPVGYRLVQRLQTVLVQSKHFHEILERQTDLLWAHHRPYLDSD